MFMTHISDTEDWIITSLGRFKQTLPSEFNNSVSFCILGIYFIATTETAKSITFCTDYCIISHKSIMITIHFNEVNHKLISFKKLM